VRVGRRAKAHAYFHHYRVRAPRREIHPNPAQGTLACMHARSALFDIYGDHLRRRGGMAPVAVLVRLLAPLGVAAPAVRTAISRMVRQGWLVAATLPGGPGYALTERAERRLDAAYERIYRTREQTWDGTWDLVLLEPSPSRPARERIASGLAYLGYAPVRPGTWISPRRCDELPALVAAEGAVVERFSATCDGGGSALAARAWDLAAIRDRYLAFEQQALTQVDTLNLDDERAYVVRSTLVHEWRKLLFIDPGLPDALLPTGWDGARVAARFDAAAGALAPAADRFVTRCLGAHPVEAR